MVYEGGRLLIHQIWTDETHQQYCTYGEVRQRKDLGPLESSPKLKVVEAEDWQVILFPKRRSNPGTTAHNRSSLPQVTKSMAKSGMNSPIKQVDAEMSMPETDNFASVNTSNSNKKLIKKGKRKRREPLVTWAHNISGLSKILSMAVLIPNVAQIKPLRITPTLTP